MPAYTDGQIQSNVLDELAQDSRINLSDVSVDTSLGWVTLRGTVASYSQRTLAKQDAKDVVGVSGVTNLLSVRPIPRSDLSIENEIASDMACDYSLEGQDIALRVHHGVVTLTGNVNEYYEKSHATDVASRVAGVNDVLNLLEVNRPPKFTDQALAQRIKDRMAQNDETRWVANQIQVKVDDGEATLSGNVNFWSERDHAQQVASQTDGIVSVHNQLKVLDG